MNMTALEQNVDGVVTPLTIDQIHALQQALGIIPNNPRGHWVPGMELVFELGVRRDTVLGPIGSPQESAAYSVISTHTSGVFADDLAAGLLGDNDSAQLRVDLFANAGASKVGFFLGLLGSNDRTLEQKGRETRSILDFVQPGDAGDHALALARALVVADHVVFPNTQEYAIKSNQNIAQNGHKTIDYNGALVKFSSQILLSAPVAITTTLTEAVLRYATSVKLASVAGINPGDVLSITTSIAVDTAWQYKKKDSVRVKAISGLYVELDEPLNFWYGTGDAGLAVTVYEDRRLTVNNLNAELIVVSGQGMMSCLGLNTVEFVSPVGVGAYPYNMAVEPVTRRCIVLSDCVNVKITNPTFERLSYPVLVVGGTRNTVATNVTVRHCRHSIEPGDWASNVRVIGMNAQDCAASVSSHPAFDVHYSHVRAVRETELPNLRCIRASLSDAYIQVELDNSATGPYFHNVSLNPAFSALFDDADMDLDGVEIVSPPARTIPTIGAASGRNVTVTRVVANNFAGSSLGGIGLLSFGPGCQFNQTVSSRSLAKFKSSSNGIRTKFTTDKNPLLPAYLLSGYYHIDPSNSVVDQTSAYLKCYGPVVESIAGEPAVVPLRIHTNAFTQVDGPSRILGILKLRGFVKHNNAGGFSCIEKTFNFYQTCISTSGVIFPLVPIISSGLSGQSNESITLTLSSPAQGAATELGANSDYYVEAVVTLASGRTSPIYSLTYELELIRQ